jgi:two-component system chemotaxis response regulator CheY
MKILLIDDSTTSRQLLVKYLSQLGYTDIVQAADGVEGLQRLQDTPDIKLVLLDRYMPNMDGLEFMQRFKSDPRNQYVQVSMVTTEDDMGEKLKTIAEYKADYYITKPVTTQALVRMFSKLFGD